MPQPSVAYAAGTIFGTAYRDYNSDGSNDAEEPGIGGITVTAYDAAGANQGTTTTDSSGAYSLTATGTGPYRVEFTGLPSYLQPSVSGSSSGTTVQFVPDGSSPNVDLGLHNPGEYCEANPSYGLSCYINGDSQHSSNVGEPALARFEYTDRSGLTASTKDADVFMEDVGSTWGLAYDRQNGNLYLSALLRRHIGLGPDGIGAIYLQTDYTDDNSVSLFYDFGTAAGNDVPATVARFPGAGTAFGQEGPCKYCDNVDADVFPLAGKRGFGDIEMSQDGNSLRVVNLFDRKIYSINVDGAPAHTEITGTPWLDNAICGGTGVARPWGLAHKDGEMYVGVVCDGSTSSCDATNTCSDLTAHIFSHDGSAWSTVLPTPIVLNYERMLYNSVAGSYWHPWVDNYADMKQYVDLEYGNSRTDAQYPQPILSDIEFDTDGSMILGFADRSMLQFGYASPAPDDGPSDIGIRYFTAGDVLRVGYDNSGSATTHSTTYQLESNGQVYAADGTLLSGSSTISPAGPGGREFYDDQWTGIGADRTDAGLGSLALKPGSGEVIVISSDAFRYYGAGVMFHDNDDGEMSGGVQVYSSNFNAEDGTSAKAGGLGDLELFCSAAPLEIGNRVWEDSNGNGIQDPGEPAIAGVTIELYDSSDTFVGTTVTDSDGEYYFSDLNVSGGLLPNTDYEIRISTSQPTIVGYSGPSPANVGSAADINDQSNANNLSDSNGVLNGSTAVAQISTGSAGQNNHTYDFGFTPVLLSLGDLIWNDTNNDGIFNNAEIGINGVSVELYLAGVDPLTATPLDAVTTDPDGRYLFQGLPQGQYFVHIPPSNFGGGQPLNGLYSSTPTEQSPNNDENEDSATGGVGDDNGRNHPLPETYGISSGNVALTDNSEPTGDDVNNIDSGTEDADSNLTIDFGFSNVPPPTVELGDRIWMDANNDGIMNNGEGGIENVTVELYLDGQTPGVDAPFGSETTDADGNYLFEYLEPGSYFAYIPPAEFSGGDLDSMFSSVPTESNPNNDENEDAATGGTGDDNGLNDSDPATNGIRTGVIVLDVDVEPTGDDVNGVQVLADDADSNLTLDLGFFTPVSLGNYVWEDLDSDGQQGGGQDSPISGAIVELFDVDGVTPATDINGNPVGSITTPANGEYNFINLLPGDYVVQVTPPEGYDPTIVNIDPDPDTNASNTDSNGILQANGTVQSLPITLTSGDEPTNDGDVVADNNSNLTVDFGFVPRPDMAVTKTVNPSDPVSANDIVTYTIGVENTGYVTLTNVSITDTVLPATGLSYVSDSTEVTYWLGTPIAPQSYWVGDDYADNTFSNTTAGSTGAWTSDWLEFNDDGVSTTGFIWMDTSFDDFNINDVGAFVSGAYISRTLNLQGVDTATISFDFNHGTIGAGDNPSVLIQIHDGATWNTVFTAQEGSGGTQSNINILPYLNTAGDTQVRYFPQGVADDWNYPLGGGGTRYPVFYFDNLRIDWSIPGVSAGYNTVDGSAAPVLTSPTLYDIPVGKFITVTYQMQVDDPINVATIEFLNTAEVGSDEMPPITDTASLPVDNTSDWGDLPDRYGTLSGSAGANHRLDGVTFLGSGVDAETDGQPDAQAASDDDNPTSAGGPDDEDGIRFLSPIMPNRPFTIEVTAGGDGFLNAWIDFDGDDTLEQIGSTDQPLSAGVHTLVFNAPGNTVTDETIYSRFRFTANTSEATTPTGAAATGEVEDYALLAIGDTVWLDLDADGTQDGGAEVGIDGVLMNLLNASGDPVLDGAGSPITTTTASGGLYGFAGLPEDDYIVEMAPENWDTGGIFAAGGTYAGAVGTPTRGSDDGNDTDDNGNNDLAGVGTGIQSDVITLTLGGESGTDNNVDPSIDFGVIQPNEFGDLPAIYGTTVISGGASHVNGGSAFLGSTVDSETDGSPSAAADGDDTTAADEDGIAFLTPLTPGTNAIIQVTAAQAGHLNAWIDFDADGTLDPINLAAVGGTPMGGSINDYDITASGTFTMTIVVPATATITDTIYSRFRMTSDDPAGTLGTTGAWPNGEVEDYALTALGDTVWFDWDNVGDQDVPEPVIAGVVMNLLDGSGSPITDADGNPIQTTTDGNGNYSFAGLPEGNYIVEIDYSNWDVGGLFGPGGLYEGATGTNGSGGDDMNNTDDNGGIDGQTVTVTNTIRSAVINLAIGAESAADGDSNQNTDMTIDFGLFVAEYDYGDLPNTYGTTDSQNGPRHLQTGNTFLGAGVDMELDGIPSLDATGDDAYTTTITIVDDEDGIEFSPLAPGQTAIITVSAGTDGFLNAWFDFDADGTLDPVTVVSGPGAGGTLSDVNLTAGVHVLEISVPANATSTETIYSRFRFTEFGGEATTPNGTANSGEVEDYALSAIGDTVWYDRDRDGFQDPGEVGIEGVLVNLLDSSGNPVLDAGGSPIQTTTNMTGTYGFAGLPDGDYMIQIDPSNWNASNVFGPGGDYENAYNVAGAGGGDGDDDSDNTDDNGDNDNQVAPAGGVRSGVITIGVGLETDEEDGDPNTDLTIDFGFFFDSYDWGDLPDGYSTSSATSGPSHLIVGDVYLGSSVDNENDGAPGNGANGDDGDGSDDEDGVIFFTPLSPGRLSEVRVFANSDGYLSSFIDFDADGTLDTVNISSLDSTSVVSTVNNLYLEAGWHTFYVDVPVTATISDTMYSRFRFTSQDGGATTPTGAAPDGEVEDYPLGSIGNRIWEDLNVDGFQDIGELGIPGVVVELWGIRDAVGSYITTTTGSNGEYYFAGLPEETYVVQLHEDNWLPGSVFGPGGSHEGWFGTPGQGGDDQVDTDDNGGNDNGKNLYGDPSILSNAITLTLGVDAGKYIITPTIDVDYRDFTIDFGLYPPGSIGDTIWGDLDISGTMTETVGDVLLPDVVVTLTVPAGTGPYTETTYLTTTTSVTGFYLFDGLPVGTYTVTVDTSTLPVGYDPDPSYDPDGGTDSQSAVTIGGGNPLDNRDQDFSYPPAGTLSVGNQLWFDTNNNGLMDAGEQGIDDVVVALYNVTGNLIMTDTTAAGGFYLFDELIAGTYTITIPAINFQSDGRLEGYHNSLPTAADANDNVNSDDNGINVADPSIDGISSTPIALNYGDEPDGTPDSDGDTDPDSNLTVDFGFYTMSLGNQVWEDLDNNGVIDAGESGISGIRVDLLDASGGVLDSTTTDATGYYTFTGLISGTYSVSITAPSGYVSSAPDAGDPDSDIDDGDDNGIGNAGGTIVSHPITMIPGLSVNGSTTNHNGGSTDNVNVDFGLYQPVAVGDNVWFDDDVDGIQDSGESGVPNVTVTLYDADTGSPVTDGGGAPLADITDVDGEYIFEGLPPGNYYTVFDLSTLPGGYLPTVEDAPSASDSEDSDANNLGEADPTGFLASGEQDLTLDMGIYYPVSVGDRVWYDDNRNGIQDVGEDGVPSISVTVYDNATGNPVTIDAEGNAVVPAQTDESGHYSFDGLPHGDYFVIFDLATLPTGYEVTRQDSRNDDLVDSDADPTTGQTAPTGPLHVNSALADPSLDMGIFGHVVVGDFVWEDLNGDGIQDAGEAGIEGITATLYDTATGTPVTDGSGSPLTDATDIDGSYAFRELPPSDYYVVFSNLPAGYVVTDEDVNGNVLDANDSDVDPVSLATDPTGYISTTLSNLTLDMGLVQPVSVGDYVWNDQDGDGIQDPSEPGIEHVTATLYDTSTGLPVSTDLYGNPVGPIQTDSDGGYLFEELHPGDYYVVFSDLPAGFFVTHQDAGTDDAADSDVNPATLATPATGFLDSNDRDLTLDMGLVLPVRVGDFAWYDTDMDGVQDEGETGVENVTVTIYHADGTPVTNDLNGNPVVSRQTDAAGGYLFENLYPGDYYVQFDLATLPAGYQVTIPNADTNDIDSDASVSNGTTGTTGPILGGGQNLNLDMGIVQLADVRVGDYVWHDLNGDGVQNAGEPGIPGVTATLYDTTTGQPVLDPLGDPLTNMTDGDGFYLFEELPSGDYYVVFSTLPAGYQVTQQNAGGNDATDSDVDPTTLRTSSTGLLNIGEQDRTLDMGLYLPASIGDTVWLDVDADGVQEPGEPGVANVTVRLYDSDSNLLESTRTDVEGHYIFSNLTPSDYFVEFVTPPAHSITTQNVGADDTLDSDVDPETFQTVVTTLTSGERDLSWDAGLYQDAAIGDTVWLDADGDGIQESGEEPIPGVTVHLYNGDDLRIATTTTDDNGHYGFSGLMPGDYSVGFVAPNGLIPTRADSSTTDAVDSDSVDSDADPDTGLTPLISLETNEHQNQWDAGFTVPASIGNYVWLDTNRDGIKEDVEEGIGSVTVILYVVYADVVEELVRTLTDNDGFFEFTDLLPGDYQLGFIEPYNMNFTQQNVDRSDLFNSDADPDTGLTTTISLEPGENAPDWGAGLVATPTSLDEIEEPDSPGRVLPVLYLPLIE